MEKCLECGWEDGGELSADGGLVARTQRTDTRNGLEDATCLVTGASRGIGRAIAKRLGAAGAHTILNYRSSEREAVELSDRIEQGNGSATTFQADVSNEDDVAEMARHLHREVGDVDVVVNNAGINADSTLSKMEYGDWRHVMSVNLDGVYHVTRAFLDDIKGAEDGRLINVSSVVGRRGNYGQANYAATKSAIFGFTKSLALELAPHDTTANCVAPGFTKTSMVNRLPESIKQEIIDDIPLGRFAEPDEIADTVAFLASPRSSYLTGEVLGVDGGMSR